MKNIFARLQPRVMKKAISIIIAAIFALSYNFEYAFAAVPEPPQIPKQPTMVGVAERPNTFPYKKPFAITAYYRPVPGQQHYATGSYEAETRLNGDMHSADGTVVYPGMVAAPKSYPFGMKMYIPGVGIVAVHDRGGAIVEVGKKSQEYDRLDIWMGVGDKGLERALAWGKRIKEVIVYGADDSIKEEVYLEDYTLDEHALASTGAVSYNVKKYNLFPKDIWYGGKGDDVKKLQNIMAQLEYFDQKQDGYYGKTTREAVFEFQKENDVVSSWDENGAGHTGPQTRWKLELTYNAFNKEKFPRSGIRKGNKDPENIKLLQKILAALGYKVDVTGEFDDQTETSVTMFQIDHGVLSTTASFGTGVFGPQTRKMFIKKYLVEIVSGENKENQPNIVPTGATVEDPLEKDLQLGDRGSNVKALQKELIAMNYLKIKPTGYFGVLTKHAVFKFQQAMKLVDNENKSYAGIFGPVTRGKLNQIIAERGYTKRMIAEKSAQSMIAAAQNTSSTVPQIAISAPQMFEVDSITDEIDYGEDGNRVKNLQKVLQKLGYFKSGLISGYFGDETKQAVLRFQKDKGIVSSESDTGAGRVGPTTKDVLNRSLSS